MQSEQLILQRLDSLSARLDEMAERRRATDELFEEMTPIAREALAAAVTRLDELDRKGTFAFLAELGAVGRRISEGFSPADVRQLADSIVPILDVVRALTRPEVLQIASDAAASLHDASQAKPLGAFRALRATRDDDVQKGLGVFIDLLRRIGHGVNTSEHGDGHALDQKAKLAELLGPRRARMLPAPRVAAPTAAPAPAPPVAEVVERPIDPSSWTREVAKSIAAEQGVVLDAPRWALIDAARDDYAATKAAPNIQRLKSIANVSTKDLYALFPKAPARTIAKIAGLPKPAGCL